MSKEALIMVITVWTIVPSITAYFFYKVLTTPKKEEPDSFSENDED
jgi:hypothetical protein